ncbi:MAG: ATP-binding protein, partial [Candidatus Thermoplasmatota archaeon]|nr:ATP-binding protein [Candidatus Thermoplasmatota archaeon]
VGMMKKLFRDARQPLFGRASGFMRLKPFDFKNTVGFLTNNSLSFEECVIAYSVFGGVPRYLAEIENGIDDIHRLLYSPLAPLKDEGRNILSMEFGSEHKGYFSILESISRGRSTPKEIADYAGMEIGTVAKYLGELSQEYDIVAKHLPIACTNKKRVRYKLDDNFFDFWFKFIYSRLSRIEMYPDDAYSSMLDELDAFVGRKFEGIVREVLVDTRHPLVPTKTGSWWSRTGDEIDIVALDEKNGRALFVETKWRNRPADWSIAERLMAKAEMVQWHNAERKELYLVVSKSGFTQRCLERMDNEGVLHWDMSELEKIVGGTLPN